MGLNDTGKVNEEATAEAGRGKSVSRDAGDTGPVNPNATKGAGRGYEPIRIGARAMAERVSYNETEVVIRKRVDPVVGEGIKGSFYTRYTDPVGDMFLQGGIVNGKEVLTSALKLYDHNTEWEPHSDGDHLYLNVTGNAVVADGVIVPGFSVTSVSVSYGNWVEDTYPTRTSSGVCHISLGTFTDSGFLTAGPPGHKTVSWCPGGSYNH